MAKGQQKKTREDKKPKQDKSKGSGQKSEYAMSMSSNTSTPQTFKKK